MWQSHQWIKRREKHYVTVTGEGLTIQGWKETTLIIGSITMQVCFIVANVQSPLIGLPDLNDSRTTIHTGDKPYIEQFGHCEQLLHIGSHLHVATMAVPGFHTPNEIQLGPTINMRYSPTSSTTLIVGDIFELSQQANIPRQLRQPPQLTQQEQEAHRVAHLPY
eukprot:537174-Amphidinium_carterae.7